MLERGAWGFRILGASFFLNACQFQGEAHFSTEPPAAAKTSPQSSVRKVLDVYARVTDTCVLFESGEQSCFGNIDDGEHDYFPAIVERIDCERRQGLHSGCRVPDISVPGEQWQKLRSEQTRQTQSKKQQRIIREAFAHTKKSHIVSVASSKSPHSQFLPTHHCALLAEGKVECIDEETLQRKSFLSRGAKQIFGGQRLCAQLEDDSLVCAPFWLSELTPVHRFPPLPGIISFQSGRQLACAQTARGVSCLSFKNRMKEDPVFGWVPAADETGRLWQPFKGRAEKLSVGDSHACALNQSHELHCWGSRRTGQLGDDAPRLVLNEAHLLESIEEASQLVAGSHHSCAINNGRVLCWGDNSQAQLGKSSSQLDFSAQPVEIPFTSSVESLSAGSFHTCALTKDGSVSCWGQMSEPASGPLKILPLPGKTRQIVSLGEQNCALSSDAQVTCWSSTPSTLQKFEALNVAALSGATDLSLTPSHLCALMQGKAKCLAWEKAKANESRKLSTTPDLITELPQMNSISGSCGISKDNHAWCWGEVRQEPQKPGGKVRLKAFQVEGIQKLNELWTESDRHFCADSLENPEAPPECALTYIHHGPPGSIDEHTPHDGDSLRWDGNGVTRLDPALSPLRSIAWGSHHQCIISSSGKVYCWGGIARGESGAVPQALFSEDAIKIDLDHALSNFSCAHFKDPVN